MDKDIIYKIVPATHGPRHHFFGFHDLVAVNQGGDKLLSLEVETINRPPLPGEKANVGYVDINTHEFVLLGQTNAFNYPQGARQQWIDSRLFIVNNQVGDHWGADIYDTVEKRFVKSIDNTCHCLSMDKRTAYGINYARLHRLGGYGYIGLPDPTADEEAPTDDGIYATDLETNKTRLLISINDVANCMPESSSHNGVHHFVTHPVLSPDGKRIAFLHRFWLSDGGIRTRLMTVGVDNGDLRCLGFGFLSHFDWKDDSYIFIWGRSNSSIDAMRSNPVLSNPIVKPLLPIAKRVIKKLLKKSAGMSMNFLMITDEMSGKVTPFAQGIMTCDGHPMCSPSDRDICICDTYPDEKRERTLFTYRFSTNERRNLGKFRMSDEQPDLTLSSRFTQGIDSKILRGITLDQLAFTRSGLHCDLHPRWNADGSVAIFDSIHEGTRQIYLCRIK